MLQRYIALAAVFLVLGAVFGAVFLNDSSSDNHVEAATIGEGAPDFNELQKRFQTLAKEKGGEYAFEVLKRAQLPPNTDLHLLGHGIGDELYSQKGVDGIMVCTQDFRNACSHSIVIGALNEFGEPALSMIRDACKKAPGGSGAYTMCYHGLGHGVFAFFSYEIPQTVEFCRKTGTPEYNNREYTECVGGMIMELMGGGGHDMNAWVASRQKYLDPLEPLAPCMDAIIPEDAKQVCLTYLTPRLWELAGINMGTPQPNMFAMAFRYCDALPREQQILRDACYGGFGKEFLPLTVNRDIRDDVQYSDTQLQTVVEWCGFAGAEDGKNACIADAVASAFWGGEKNPDTSFRLCKAATSAGNADSCYQALARNIASYTNGSRREQLCTQIPAGFRDRCLES